MTNRNREKVNQYWRDQRAAFRLAKLTQESKALSPEVFLSNPNLIRPVADWIKVAGEDYARKELDRLGVSSAEGITRIIEAAKQLS